MKLKPIVTSLLLLFVVGSLVFLVVDESRKRAGTDDAAAGPQDAPQQTFSDAAPDARPVRNGPASRPTATAPTPRRTTLHKVIAYYFHTSFRCPSCRKIETWSREAIQTGFAPALKDGRLEWRMVNVEKPEHAHFVKDYQLYTKSLVLVAMHDGKQVRWKNLPRVWELLGDKRAFLTYVHDEVRAFLQER